MSPVLAELFASLRSRIELVGSIVAVLVNVPAVFGAWIVVVIVALAVAAMLPPVQLTTGAMYAQAKPLVATTDLNVPPAGNVCSSETPLAGVFQYCVPRRGSEKAITPGFW